MYRYAWKRSNRELRPLTREDSRPVRLYDVVSKNGDIWAIRAPSAGDAADWAKEKWPDQEKDEDRTGKGWSIKETK